MTPVQTLVEARELIAGRDDFREHAGDGYVSIDYTFMQPDTFDDERRTELRGVKFDPVTGQVLARPLHKFFNVGERLQPSDLDFSQPHVVLEKLDGSMVHPCFILHSSTPRLMTRAGITRVSQGCERQWIDRVSLLSCRLLENGWTPTFEWIGPNLASIVQKDFGTGPAVQYPKDRLVLLAVRETNTGRYLSDHELDLVTQANRAPWPRPRVLATDAYGDWAGLRRHCEGLEGAEGFVVRFADGTWVKVKAPWYVLLHKTKDALRFEKDVVRLILEDRVDDALGLLPADEGDRLLTYANLLREWVHGMARNLNTYRNNLRKTEDRRAVAGAIQRYVPKPLRGVAFQIYDGKDGWSAVKRVVLDACATGPRIASLLDELGGPRWHGS